jgi:hypothetical protein
MIDKMAPRGIRLKDLVDIVERRSPRGGEIERVAAAVRLSTEIEELADRLVDHYVQHARRAGCSWLQIGRELGVTRQAAHQRFGGERMRMRALGRKRRDADVGPRPGATDETKLVLSHAQEEARLLDHDHVGTEHILLGLLARGGATATALTARGMRVAAVRGEVERVVGRGPGSTAEEIPLTPRAKEVLALSRREASAHGKEQIGPEHVFLGLLREGDGLAARILADSGVPLTRLRKEILAML